MGATWFNGRARTTRSTPQTSVLPELITKPLVRKHCSSIQNPHWRNLDPELLHQARILLAVPTVHPAVPSASSSGLAIESCSLCRSSHPASELSNSDFCLPATKLMLPGQMPSYNPAPTCLYHQFCSSPSSRPHAAFLWSSCCVRILLSTWSRFVKQKMHIHACTCTALPR